MIKEFISKEVYVYKENFSMANTGLITMILKTCIVYWMLSLGPQVNCFPV